MSRTAEPMVTGLEQQLHRKFRIASPHFRYKAPTAGRIPLSSWPCRIVVLTGRTRLKPGAISQAIQPPTELPTIVTFGPCLRSDCPVSACRPIPRDEPPADRSELREHLAQKGPRPPHDRLRDFMTSAEGGPFHREAGDSEAVSQLFGKLMRQQIIVCPMALEHG